jgi:beta propeller repeat protein
MERVMKTLLLPMLMTALMLTSIAQADYTINRFPVCEDSGDQEMPDIDGEIVVWEGGDGNIHWLRMGDTTANIIATGGTQSDPKVSGDVVVWYDNDTQRDIFSYNLQAGGDPLNITNDSAKQWYPDISGDSVVYEDYTSGVYDIYVYSITFGSSEIIEASSTHQIRPAIDGDLVVWGDGRDDGYTGYDIYFCDLSVTPYAATPVSLSDGDQWEPAVSNRVIVWREDPGDGSGRNIYGYDLDDPGTGRFDICVDPGDQDFPAISGNIVVWQDTSDSAIWAIDLNDLAAGPFEISDGTSDNQRPAVSGKTIVWQRSGDIWAAELLIPSTVTVTDPNGGEWVEAATAMTITWTSTGPVSEVLIEFSSDGGVEWTPVATIENTGSYLWEPIADVDSINCLIRVTNTADATATDTSDVSFEIYQIPNSITVVDPNGSGQFLAGSEMEISWTSAGDVNDVKIMFSPDNEQSWQIITESTENDGAFTWPAIPADANSTQCMVHISDAADSSTWDMNDNYITVFQCPPTLTADLTGDCFVDIADFAELAYQWLLCGNPHDETWCTQ